VKELAALAAYARQVQGDQTAPQAIVPALAALKTSLGLTADLNATDPAVKMALAGYVRNGLGKAASVEQTATVLADLKAALGLDARVLAGDAVVREAIATYARDGLAKPDTVQATVTVLGNLKKTLGLPDDVYKNDPVIKEAVATYARKGLGNPATVEATAKVLEGLGDSAAEFKDDPIVREAIVKFAQDGLKDAAKARETATALVSLMKSLGLAPEVFAKDPKIAAALSRFVLDGLKDAAKVQETAAALAGLQEVMKLDTQALKNDAGVMKAISEFARNGLKDAATVQATATALASLKAVLGLADDAYKGDPAIQAAITESAQKGLRNAATVEATVAYMEKVNATMGFAPKVDGKDPFIRSNLALYRGRLAKLKENDNSAAVALAGELLKPDAGLSDVVHKNLVAGLQEQLAAWRKYQSQLDAKGGPKDAGFTLSPQLSSDDVKVYERQVGGQTRRLVFGRLIVNGEAVFLCTTETPIWAVDALVDGGKELGDVLGIDAPVSVNKQGPCPWYTNKGISVLTIRPGWLPAYKLPDGNTFWPFPAALCDDPKSPTKLVPATANASRDHPLDWISPDAAKGIATGLGCRLATSAEWLAAAAQQVNLPNLRDSSWKQVADHLNNAPNRQGIIPLPCLLEKFSFAPSTDLVAWDGATLTAAAAAIGLTPKWNLPGGAYDDKHPFFWPADPEFDANPGGKPKFKDLIGNVGEYVVDDTR
ncbi:MAG: hypothetical protein ACHRHE_11205, partial [Tepidisphaerales bacterium]